MILNMIRDVQRKFIDRYFPYIGGVGYEILDPTLDSNNKTHYDIANFLYNDCKLDVIGFNIKTSEYRFVNTRQVIDLANCREAVEKRVRAHHRYLRVKHKLYTQELLDRQVAALAEIRDSKLAEKTPHGVKMDFGLVEIHVPDSLETDIQYIREHLGSINYIYAQSLLRRVVVFKYNNDTGRSTSYLKEVSPVSVKKTVTKLMEA